MPLNVLISGAGIAGPTLAFFLAKTGARITIVEKAKVLLPHGQNIDLQGSALSVISKMGLMDKIRAANTTEKGTQFIDPDGKPFAFLPVVKGAPSPSSEFEILRGDLAKILNDAVKDLPNVHYLLDTTIKEVLSNDVESVKVELSNGSVHEYDLLVAADGQWSKVRKQCFPPDSVTPVDKGLYCAYWTAPRLPRDNDWWNIYIALNSRGITLRPDPYGSVRVSMTLMPSTEVQKTTWRKASKSGSQAQQELLKETFWDAGWEAQRLLGTMEAAPDFYFQTIQQIRMSKWSNSRVICLGDTAYAPTPLTGMGTTLAIIGGYVLAGELSKLGEAEHPAEVFEAYESIFRPYIEKRQSIPFFVPAIVHPGPAWKRSLLQTAVWLASKAVPIITPWLGSKSANGFDDDGFPLPIYSVLENETPK